MSEKKLSRIVRMWAVAVLVLLVVLPSMTLAEADKIEITFAWWGSAGRHEIYNSVTDLFEEAYPHIKVHREYAPWDEYWDRLTTKIAGGSPPDVMQYNSYLLGEYASRGVLMDLQRFVDTNVIDLGGWDELTKGCGMRDGKLYAIPFSFTLPAAFFNASLLEEIGVPVPSSNTTMTLDEFADFAIAIQKALDKAGLEAWALQDPGGFENWFETFIRQRGKKVLLEDNGAFGFDRQDLIDYFDWVDKLRKAGAVPPAEIMAEEGGQPWENSMLVRRRVVITFSNSNQLKVFQRCTDDRLDILRLPVDPEGALPHGEPLDYMTSAVSASTKHPEEAALFVNFYTNNIEAQRVLDAEHGPPASPEVLRALESEFSRPIKLTAAHLEQVRQSVPPYHGRPAGVRPLMDGIGKANQEIAFGAKSVERAVDDLLREASRGLKRQ